MTVCGGQTVTGTTVHHRTLKKNMGTLSRGVSNCHNDRAGRIVVCMTVRHIFLLKETWKKLETLRNRVSYNQNGCAGRTVMDSVVPYLCNFFSCSSSLPSTPSMTDRHRHNGPSRAFISKHFNSWNMGTGITSLKIMTNLQDRPS